MDKLNSATVQPLPEDLPRRLANRLEQPLLGRRAVSSFAPELSYGRHQGPAPSSARPAAVLLLLYPHQGEWHVPLMVRPETMVDHAGQVSLPGGVIEPGESSAACALREWEEELGAPREGIELLGALTPLLVFISNFHVTCWVATMATRPVMCPNPAEVAEVIELPLAVLLDRAAHATHTIKRRSLEFRAPHLAYGQHKIWGATHILLGELACLLEDMT